MGQLFGPVGHWIRVQSLSGGRVAFISVPYVISFCFSRVRSWITGDTGDPK